MRMKTWRDKERCGLLVVKHAMVYHMVMMKAQTLTEVDIPFRFNSNTVINKIN